MTDLDDCDRNGRAINLVDYAIVSHPNTKQAFRAAQLLDAEQLGVRVDCNQLERLRDTSFDGFGKSPNSRTAERRNSAPYSLNLPGFGGHHPSGPDK